MELQSMLGELIPCGGGDPIPLLTEKLLIGRRNRCDISLRFPNVSSHHCELELIDGYWFVHDMSSRNGIKVNGDRCDTKWLMPGDILSVAKHRYEIIYTPTRDRPPPQEDDDPFAKGLLEKAGLASRNPAEVRHAPLVPSAGEVPDDGPADPDDEMALKLLNEDEDAK